MDRVVAAEPVPSACSPAWRARRSSTSIGISSLARASKSARAQGMPLRAVSSHAERPQWPLVPPRRPTQRRRSVPPFQSSAAGSGAVLDDHHPDQRRGVEVEISGAAPRPSPETEPEALMREHGRARSRGHADESTAMRSASGSWPSSTPIRPRDRFPAPGDDDRLADPHHPPQVLAELVVQLANADLDLFPSASFAERSS